MQGVAEGATPRYLETNNQSTPKASNGPGSKKQEEPKQLATATNNASAQSLNQNNDTLLNYQQRQVNRRGSLRKNTNAPQVVNLEEFDQSEIADADDI